jgi:hypothetical protein
MLLLVGFLAKKLQSLFQEKKNNEFPFIYFPPLFFVSFAVYDLLFKFFLDKFSLPQMILSFNLHFLFELGYNLFVAGIVFYIYKRFLKPNTDNRQLKLFTK